MVEFAASGFAIESSVDFDSVLVHPPIPGPRFSTKCLQIGNSPLSQTLPREPDLDLRLGEPASVPGRVVIFELPRCASNGCDQDL
jgi:hypothetical protein